MVAAEDTAAAAARAQLRRAFLLRTEEAERTQVTAVSADLRRVDEDIKQVCTVAACLVLSHRHCLAMQLTSCRIAAWPIQ